MELIRGLHNVQPRHRGCVLTIGNFDGVHLGHRALLEQLETLGREVGEPTLLMTFEPQPQEYFRPESSPSRLCKLREKLVAIGPDGVDRVLVLAFNEALASLPAEAFIEDILVNRLGARRVVVGDDFRFGQGAGGDFELLCGAGARFGFEVFRRDTFSMDGERVSSSRVRAALSDGNMEEAARLLGRPFAMSGRVTHGERLGRTLGYHTANIPIRRRVSPLRGVFAVQVHGVADAPMAGMANLGTRPTVGGVRTLLEVHLFDFAGSIYGRHLHVEFCHKLRDEVRFGSLDELKAQLARDALDARAALGC